VALKKRMVLTEASDALIKQIMADPDNPTLHFELGMVYKNTGQNQEGAREFQEALRLSPKYEQALEQLGETFINLKSFDDAVKILAKAVSANPSSPDAHLQLGKVYIERQWWDEALVELKKTNDLRPNYPDVHFYLGQVYRYKSWWDEALDQFQKYLDAPGDDVDKASQARDVMQQIEIWKRQLQTSPSAGNTKLIK